MADRRCFNKRITDSDAFLEMPLSTQCLYFHLNMNSTDDDGFVNNPKKIARSVGCNEDDLKLLILKGFVLAFESGVIVIKHWRMHNTLRNDRYHPTSYTEEFAQLGIKDDGSYTLATTWQPNGNHLATEHNITKHNITKHKDIYGEFKRVKLTDEELEKLIKEFGKDKTDKAIKFLDEYIEEKGYKSNSHYLAIRRWVLNAVDEHQEKPIDKVPTYDTSKNKQMSDEELERLLSLKGK